ncbi:MAG: DUF2809 domain-containing protein [Acidobacteriaceae bacterium]|jgi:hypothetical protein
MSDHLQSKETMKPRTLKSSLVLFFITVMVGLAVRMVPLGLPAVVVKYGGSMLWAVMIYWIVSTALPRWRLPVVALISGAIATAVEFFKLYHSPGMDAFRLTLPGIILLGRYFSVRDIVTYWVAISVAAWVDGGIRRAEG